jgi:hypothetical protein
MEQKYGPFAEAPSIVPTAPQMRFAECRDAGHVGVSDLATVRTCHDSMCIERSCMPVSC